MLLDRGARAAVSVVADVGVTVARLDVNYSMSYDNVTTVSSDGEMAAGSFNYVSPV